MKPSLIFFGTGPVSLHCLEGIHEHFMIEAIVTKPDRVSPNGKAHPHPVREWGETHGIRVFQVGTKTEITDLVTAERFTSSVGLVVDFGLIIPDEAIQSFKHGIINSHFSLLPKLRGADPISFAILEGLNETGVSLMKIVAAMDEGDLISQETLSLPEDITTPDLTQLLGELSNAMLIRDLPRYLSGELAPRPQSGDATYTRKLSKADGTIDWNQPAIEIDRHIRAFIGWPGSRTVLFGKDVIITKSHVYVGSLPTDIQFNENSVTTHPEVGLGIRCSDNQVLIIDRLKPAGKNEMPAGDFVRGLKL